MIEIAATSNNMRTASNGDCSLHSVVPDGFDLIVSSSKSMSRMPTSLAQPGISETFKLEDQDTANKLTLRVHTVLADMVVQLCPVNQMKCAHEGLRDYLGLISPTLRLPVSSWIGALRIMQGARDKFKRRGDEFEQTLLLAASLRISDKWYSDNNHRTRRVAGLFGFSPSRLHQAERDILVILKHDLFFLQKDYDKFKTALLERRTLPTDSPGRMNEAERLTSKARVRTAQTDQRRYFTKSVDPSPLALSQSKVPLK